MTWFGWVLAAVLAISTVATIGSIDMPRRPTTPDVAIAVVIINGLLFWGAMAVGTK